MGFCLFVRLLLLTFSFRTEKKSLLEFPMWQEIHLFQQLKYLFSLSIKTFGISVVKLSVGGVSFKNG